MFTSLPMYVIALRGPTCRCQPSGSRFTINEAGARTAWTQLVVPPPRKAKSMHDLMSATAWPSASRLPGAPDRIRTCDLCLRRATLYPAELRALRAIQYPIVGRGATGVWADEQPARRHSPLIEPFDFMPPAPSGLAPACVNVAPAFRQSKPCRWSKHDSGAVTGVTSPGHGLCRRSASP